MGAVIRQSTVHWLLGLGPDIPGALRRIVVALLDVDVAIVVADRLVLDVLAVLVVREISEFSAGRARRRLRVILSVGQAATAAGDTCGLSRRVSSAPIGGLDDEEH